MKAHAISRSSIKLALVAVLGLFCILLIAQALPVPSAMAPKIAATDPVVLHIASTVSRQQRQEAQDELQEEIIVNGMEAGSAGFHLLRPPTDPQWSAGYGRWKATIDYRWWDVPVAYDDIEYQRRIPVELDPNPAFSPTALVSQARVFANSLGSATLIAEPSGSYRVDFTFSARGVAALGQLLEPTSVVVNGRQDDWYRVDLPVGSPSTPMWVAVVSQDLAYLPFEVQGLIAAAGQGPGTVTVADELTHATASELRAWLNN